MICWAFWHVIKMMMADVENNDELFVDNAHTPKEGVEHHRKEEREGKVLGG